MGADIDPKSDDMERQLNIILYWDGTGDPGGKARGTNDWAVFNAVDRNPACAVEQLVFHENGVGTGSSTVERGLESAFGWGPSKNVRKRPKTLHVSGSQRPARRAGLPVWLQSQGLDRARAGRNRRHLRDSGPGQVPHGGRSGDRRFKLQYGRFRAHFSSGFTRAILERKAPMGMDDWQTTSVHRDGDGGILRDIEFMGVWDTVGVPWDPIADALEFFYPFRSPDDKVGAGMKRGAHALDDAHRTSHPARFDVTEETDPERLVQVWFAGVHANVGGGYAKDQMARVSLDWMATRAAASGLYFSERLREQIQENMNVHGKLYGSRGGVRLFYMLKARDVGSLWGPMAPANAQPLIHESVLSRTRAATEDYGSEWIDDPVHVVRTAPQVERLKRLEAAFTKSAASRQRNRGRPNGIHRARSLLQCATGGADRACGGDGGFGPRRHDWARKQRGDWRPPLRRRAGGRRAALICQSAAGCPDRWLALDRHSDEPGLRALAGRTHPEQTPMRKRAQLLAVLP